MTDMTLPHAAPTPGPGSCDPWKFWASCGWTGLAILAWIAVQFAVVVGVFTWFGMTEQSSHAELLKLGSHGVTISIIAILAVPAELAIVALAVKLAGCRFGDYLALVWPRRNDLLLGIACLVVLLPLIDLTSYLTGREVIPPFVSEMYRSARDSGHLWLVAIALVIAAPLAEELVFRGFMYRGLAASRVGVVGAIVIPSAVWAAMHVQYELFFMAHIFLIGLVFGWWRWKSGSTNLTLIMHGMINLASFAQVAVVTEWLS